MKRFYLAKMVGAYFRLRLFGRILQFFIAVAGPCCFLSPALAGEVFPKEVSLSSGESQQLILVDSGADDLSATLAARWVSLQPDVVSVDFRGVLTGGQKPGVAIITATLDGVETRVNVRNRGPGHYIYFAKPMDWQTPNFYTWLVVNANPVEKAGPWPGQPMERAIDLGGSWHRYFVDSSFFNDKGTVDFVLNDQPGGLQTNNLELLTPDRPYFGSDGTNVPKPSRSTSLEGTQIQVKGGRVFFDDAENLSGKLFLPGQVLEVIADAPGPGQKFVRWEGDGAKFLVDHKSKRTQLLVTPTSSITIFAVFDEVTDEFKSGREQYQALCSGCHGPTGNGFPTLIGIQEKYDEATIAQIVNDRMPTGRQETCVGSCATDIAAMLYNQKFSTPAGVCDSSDLKSMVPSPRTLRLLTSVELNASAKDLLQLPEDFSLLPYLPEDFIVNGFQTDSQSTVSNQHAFAYFDAAEKALSELKDPWSLAPSCGSGDGACYISLIGKRFFRRPLTSNEIEKFRGVLNEFGVRSLLVAFLTSPNFLYRSELGERIATGPSKGYYQLTSYEIATYLSYTFWGTTPDQVLLDLADKDQLRDRITMLEQTQRLLASPRARERFRLFIEGWLDLRQAIVADISEDLKSAMVEELKKFVEYIVFDKKGSYFDLMMSSESFINQALANHYGLGEVAEWSKVESIDGDRVGVLGKAHFFAAHATTTSSHPVKRGLFVRKNLLCQSFPPPPIGAELKPVKDPTLTTREKFEVAHRRSDCLSCHQFVDGIGFGLEAYDQKGLWREFETVPSGASKPIDASGGIGSLNSAETILSASEPVEAFSGIRELAGLLEQSRNGKACFARQYLRFTVGETIAKDQSCTLSVYGDAFRKTDGPIFDLLTNLTQTVNFSLRR